ncbi:hypothetical protein QAD02_023693 [Eretmocerus hayati]|uniref:Uncharacterized protein n=1 Tax=Eretmocerus hayati TaxID=131215 RepID=A0ACC2PY61_9HYME|nr:hypothetical protein QAD02_023693 [Eretmocerus hayati]
MDENLSRGYVQLGKPQRLNELANVNNVARIAPPVDRWNLIYLSLVLAGIGFLLPYNSFVIAVDYFQERYPDTTVIFDMSVVYIAMAFFAVLVNNVLVESLSLGTRITFGYLVSFLTLNFIVFCEIWWEVFGYATSYTINLVAVAVVSLGCTVQQSSFYGYTSMLPTRYTQAVMAGESAAGFWVSVNRIITKSLVEDERGNTSMFFAFSIITIIICFVIQQTIYKTEFVQYYINMCQERNKITLEPQEETGSMDLMDQVSDSPRGQYGVLKLQNSPAGVESVEGAFDYPCSTKYYQFSYSNPVYDPNAPASNPTGSTGTTYKVEDVVIIRGSYGDTQPIPNKKWSGIKRGFVARIEVAKLIYPYMLSIGIAYFVTLCLYPGIISEIVSCRFGSWMPVILMTSFNGADLIGKMLATLPCHWSRTQLLNFACARTLLIPLFLLCAIPRHAPIFSNELFPVVLSIILGVTNGIVGSVPMVQAPTRVPEEYRELAGNIMTLSYTTGLTVGSVLAYLLDACLGPPLSIQQICPKPSLPSVITLGPTLINSTTSFLTTNTITTNITSSTINPISSISNLTTASAATGLASTIASIVLDKVTKRPPGATKRPKIRTTSTTTVITTASWLASTLASTFITEVGQQSTTAANFAGGSSSGLGFDATTEQGYAGDGSKFITPLIKLINATTSVSNSALGH